MENTEYLVYAYLTGYVAKSLGEWDVARRRLGEALQSGCFKTMADRLAEDIAACHPAT